MTTRLTPGVAVFRFGGPVGYTYERCGSTGGPEHEINNRLVQDNNLHIITKFEVIPRITGDVHRVSVGTLAVNPSQSIALNVRCFLPTTKVALMAESTTLSSSPVPVESGKIPTS